MEPLILLTGFGEFGDVKENPSNLVVNEIASNYESSPTQPKGNSIKSCFDILEVSVDCCTKVHDKYRHRDGSDCADVPSVRPIVFVHVGVDGRGSCIKLEQFAYNNMTFRIPDQKGYQPDSECIDLSMPFDQRLQSDLPLNEYCEILNRDFYSLNIQQPQSVEHGKPASTTAATEPVVPNTGAPSEGEGHSTSLAASKESDLISGTSNSLGPIVQLSDDPGRFLCNYVYFKALQTQKILMRPHRSVFVHVPTFDKISQAVQVAIVKRLLSLITETVSEAKVAI